MNKNFFNNGYLKNTNLIRLITKRCIEARYRGSFLGLVWSFAYPLLMLAVYSFVFGVVFKARWGIEALENNSAAFPLIMFCGLTVFNIFTESVNSSTLAIITNVSYVKKVIFPLEILPLANVLTAFFFGIAWFILLILGIFIFIGNISFTILFIPLTIIPLFLLSLGMSFFVSALSVYIRDTQQAVAIITQILFFMTPIFYPISAVPENLRWILLCNPLTSIVEQTREIVLYGNMPEMPTIGWIFFFSIVIYQLGLSWFTKTKKGFADVL